MALTHEEVTSILEIIEASRADEVLLEIGETRISVLREAGRANDRSSADADARATPPPAPGPNREPLRVTAPALGTLRLGVSAGTAPVVEIGGAVEAGQRLCRIEVMGREVPVEAPVAGLIAAVSGDDGALVEFGQVLFVIDPHGSKEVTAMGATGDA